MDSSAMSWLAEMELDNSMFTDQCDFIDSFDEEEVAVIRQDLENCLSSDGNNSPPSSSTLINYNTPPESGSEPSPKVHKPNNPSSFSSKPRPNPGRTSDPIILSFGNAHSSDQQQVVIEEAKKKKKKTGRARPPSQTYDHIIAERKRREQLSQRFLLLTTIVPGLKKMDKTSVLGDTIKYMKQLQEREKILVEQVTQQQIMESAVLVNKSQFTAEDDDDGSSSTVQYPLPEIEARVCNDHLLIIRVHCEKQKGVLVNLLSNVENLKLIVVQTNVATFGNLTLDVTIMAQMEKEFKLTVKEIVKRLGAALQKGN